MNRYRVTLTGPDGTTFLAERGVRPDPADRCVLTAPFTRRIGFSRGQIPGPIDPVEITAGLAARTAADLPRLVNGDIWDITIEVADDAGAWRLYSFDFCRLAETDVQLRPGIKWAARASLSFADTLADLKSRFPTPDDSASMGSYFTHSTWLSQWMNVSAPDINVWRLTSARSLRAIAHVPEGSAWEHLRDFTAGYLVNDLPTVIRPKDGHDTPDHYTWGSGLWSGGNGWNEGRDVNRRVRGGYITHAINRYLWEFQPLPMRLVCPSRFGGITVTPQFFDPADSDGVVVIPCRAVPVPTTARRARDTIPNVHIVTGHVHRIERDLNTEEYRTRSITLNATALSPDDVRRSREISTVAQLGTTFEREYADLEIDSEAYHHLSVAYEPDPAVASAAWEYGSLTVHGDRLTAQEFAPVVRRLTIDIPWVLGGVGDGLAARPVVIAGVDPTATFDGKDHIVGVLTNAELTIRRGGHFDIDITLRPGPLPLREDHENALTAEALLSEPGLDQLTPSDFDPNVTALDMRLVGRHW